MKNKKFKYEVYIFHPLSEDDCIELQKLLFKYGVKWSGVSNSISYDIYVDGHTYFYFAPYQNMSFLYSNHNYSTGYDQAHIDTFKNPNYKIYTSFKIITHILKYGYEKPKYKPHKIEKGI